MRGEFTKKEETKEKPVEKPLMRGEFTKKEETKEKPVEKTTSSTSTTAGGFQRKADPQKDDKKPTAPKKK